jgi:plastocyanin
MPKETPMSPFLDRRLATTALAAWLALAPTSFGSVVESASTAPAESAARTAAPMPTPPPPIVHVVNVSCCAFSDSFNGSNHTFITPGTTVEWQRLDASWYSVTSGTGSANPQVGAFFNGFLVPPAATFTYTFPGLGTFPYYCQFHENVGMSGVIHVVNPAVAYVLLGGCISSNGAELTLGNSAMPRIGDASFALWISGGAHGASAYMFLADALATSSLTLLPDCIIQLDLSSVTQFVQAGLTPSGPNVLNANGSTTFTFPIPVAPLLAGAQIAAQGLVFDSLVPGGIVLSNAALLVLGA